MPFPGTSGGGDPVLTQGLASSSLPVAEAVGALPSPRFSALPVCADAACAVGIRLGGASANVAMSVRVNFMLLRLQGKAQAEGALVVTSDGLAVPHGEDRWRICHVHRRAGAPRIRIGQRAGAETLDGHVCHRRVAAYAELQVGAAADVHLAERNGVGAGHRRI